VARFPPRGAHAPRVRLADEAGDQAPIGPGLGPRGGEGASPAPKEGPNRRRGSHAYQG
jgi:hypothetical protein